MARRMLFNAFQMNCVTHQSPGLWTRDDDQTTRYKELDYWLDYARLVERGCFDAVFLADVVGTYDVYGGNREAALRSAAQTPVNDPMLVIPAMATVTRHLGFGVTSAMLQYHPYTFARQMSTLDHLTKGRIGWNVVTGYLDSAARAYGLEALPEHDQRYEIADEYASLCYRLWEDSWAEDAVRADRKSGVYTDPSRVRDIDHDGRHFRVHGCHVSEPSPQRTPVLFQAGTSSRGTDFAARHAECVFVIGSKPHVAGDYARGIREKAVAGGRRGEDIAVFAYMKIVVGGTEAEARRKYDDLFESVDIDGALALMCGWSGMDLSQVAMDQPIEYIETNAIRTFLHSFTAGDPSRVWTPRDIARYCGIGGAGPVLVGTPEQIADQLEDWIAAGVDGFNLAHTVLPGGLEDFIDGVVPVLQGRGRMQREYQPGTLREKLFGHARLQAPHPGATCRRPWD